VKARCDAKTPSRNKIPPRSWVQPHDAGGIGPVPRETHGEGYPESYQKRSKRRLIHAATRPLIGGAVAMPIFQSATFAYRGEAN